MIPPSCVLSWHTDPPAAAGAEDDEIDPPKLQYQFRDNLKPFRFKGDDLPPREPFQEPITTEYTCPDQPPTNPPQKPEISNDETISILHYQSMLKTNGTQESYLAACNITKQAAPSFKPLTLRMVEKASARLSGLRYKEIDCCVNSCMAYTGEYAERERCHVVRLFEVESEEDFVGHSSGPRPERKYARVLCDEPRYVVGAKGKRVARKTTSILSILSRIEAYYANPEWAEKLEYFSDEVKKSQAACHVNEAGEVEVDLDYVYHDFPSGTAAQLAANHLTEDPNTSAIMLSTDGANVKDNCDGVFWMVTATFLNIKPTEGRYRKQHIFDVMIIPGPRNPVLIDTFWYPIYEELEEMATGSWIYNSFKQEYFKHKGYLLAILGDQPDQAKLSGMASHNGVVGCTECRMTKSTGRGRYFVHGDGAWERFLKKRAKNSKAPPSYHNSPRPEGGYANANLPMRSHEVYVSTMKAWHEADGPSARDDIGIKSGIKRPVLAAKSPLFDAPALFPIDSSHLLKLNIPFNMINLFRRMDNNERLVKFLNIADRMMSTQSRQVPSIRFRIICAADFVLHHAIQNVRVHSIHSLVLHSGDVRGSNPRPPSVIYKH